MIPVVSFHEALDAQNKVAFRTISGLDFTRIMPGCTAQKLLLIIIIYEMLNEYGTVE